MSETQEPLQISEYEIQVLAKHFLRWFIQDDISSFFTGHYSGSAQVRRFTRFAEVCEHLDDQSKQMVIDETEGEFKGEYGDEWEVYKLSKNPTFFSSPADVTAIRRIVNDLPQIDMDDDDEYWREVSNVYSPEFASVLRQVSDAEFAELMERSEHDLKQTECET